MTEVGGTPRRVRVTSPLTTAQPHRRRTAVQEIDEETRVGDVYIRSLMRTQLRLAAIVIALLVVTVGALPLVFVAVPAVSDVRLLGVPLPWLLLGVVVYPLMFAAGWVYVRRSERAEQDFAELVDRP